MFHVDTKFKFKSEEISLNFAFLDFFEALFSLYSLFSPAS